MERRRYCATIIGFTIAALVLISAGCVPVASAASMRGVYALGAVDRPTPSALLDNPNVDGLTLRHSWDEIEPREGVFVWSELDQEVARARSHGKKIALGITPGIRTPQWVYSAGASQFTFVWDKPWGLPMCSQARIPAPWDPVYMSKWKTLVGELARRYGSNPAVGCLKLTGINGATEETILPGAKGGRTPRWGGACVSGDDVRNWQRIGYSRAKIEAAWTGMADTYAQLFPHQDLDLMIVARGFPPIDDFGNIMANRVADIKLSNDLIERGIASYGPRFIVQNNGLSAFYSWKEAGSLAGRTTVGFQMLWSVTKDPRCRMNGGRMPCDPHAVLQAAVDRGIDSGARFLEIYIPDLLNPDLQDVILRAHNRLVTLQENSR